MSSVAEKTLIIDQNWLDQHKNEKAHYTALDRTVDYERKTSGAQRTLQCAQKTLKLGNTIRHSATLGHLACGLKTGISTVGLVRLPGATQEAIRSLSALGSDDGISLSRKVGIAVKDVLGAIAAYGYSLVFLTANPLALIIAQITDFTSDVADFSLSASDYNQSSALETKMAANSKAKSAVSHSKNYYFLRVLKAVSGIALVALECAMWASGVRLMPVVALAVASLSATLFAIVRDVYEDMGDYSVIPFDLDVKLAAV